jgi:hypothetical protein
MRYKRGKYTKYRLMAKSPELAAAIPSFRKFTLNNFQTLLNRYERVIVKPSCGWGGAGVIAVTKQGDGSCLVHKDRRVRIKSSAESAYAYLKRYTRGKTYIVQRKIALATVKGRPFDLRVMVQRDRSGKWVVTGKLAKVAGSGYIITNIRRSRGRVLPFAAAIERSNIEGRSAGEIARDIGRISLAAARHLQTCYSIRTVGFDIGVDSRGRVWIIEPNFRPDISLFRKLKDQSAYRRIRSFMRKRAT